MCSTDTSQTNEGTLCRENLRAFSVVWFACAGGRNGKKPSYFACLSIARSPVFCSWDEETGKRRPETFHGCRGLKFIVWQFRV